MVTIYTNYHKSDRYSWKCTQHIEHVCDRSALIGYCGCIEGLSGSGVCIGSLLLFIKNVRNIDYSTTDIFIPWTLPDNVRASMLRLLAIVFKNKGGINVQVSP